MQTLNLKIQPTVRLFTAVNHCSGVLEKQKRLAQRGKKVVRALWLADFDPLCRFLYFCGRRVIMIDGSKTHKSLAGVEVRLLFLLQPSSYSSSFLPLLLLLLFLLLFFLYFLFLHLQLIFLLLLPPSLLPSSLFFLSSPLFFPSPVDLAKAGGGLNQSSVSSIIFEGINFNLLDWFLFTVALQGVSSMASQAQQMWKRSNSSS